VNQRLTPPATAFFNKIGPVPTPTALDPTVCLGLLMDGQYSPQH
jgi:hypothetical protein